MRAERFRLGLCAAVGAAALVLAACGEKKPSAAAAAPPEVGVVTLQPQSVAVTTELPGRTTALRVAEVRARVDGIVQRREFVEGSEVKQGQRLFKIDPAPYLAALASSKATLARAEANVRSTGAQAERYKALVAANAVSKQEYDNAVASYGQAQADVASGRAAVQTASINLGYTDVTAPISGRIGKAQVTEGAYVQASGATLLATVQQVDQMYVDITQASTDVLRLRREMQEGRLKSAGQNAAELDLVLPDGSLYPEKGRLQFSDITVDATTGSVTLRAIFPNPRRDLLPNMFVRARLTEAVNDNAFLVPQQGVQRDQKGSPQVFLVGADNKVSLRSITTTQTLRDKWIVTGGLKAGDRVVVEGTQKVRSGAQVKPVAAQLPQSPPAAGAAPASAASTAAPASAASPAAASSAA